MKRLPLCILAFSLSPAASCYSADEARNAENVITNERPPRFPVVSSEWKRIIEYPENHLNDFCLFLDQGRTWHALGIMGTGTLDSERSLFHSTGKDLLDRFENREPILQEDPGASLSPRKHAPGVIYHDGSYHLFYRRPSGTIMRLVSKDPYRWAGLGTTVFSERDARDVCIRKYRDTFYMYYCQFITRENIGRSAILLRKSSDLMNWSNATVVHYDTERPCTHSYLESPSVLRREEGYYLFIRNRNYDKEVKTVVLFSKNPEDFPSGERKWFAELQPVHAAEIIAVGEEVFIARVSAPSKRVNYLAPDKGGWVEIARLRFE